MNAVRRMPFAGLNVPCEYAFIYFQRSGSPKATTTIHTHTHTPTKQPSAIALCLHFAVRLILSFAIFCFLSCNFCWNECLCVCVHTENVCTACTFSFHRHTHLTRKHVSSSHTYATHTHTHTQTRPLSLGCIELPFLSLFSHSFHFSLKHSRTQIFIAPLCFINRWKHCTRVKAKRSHMHTLHISLI